MTQENTAQQAPDEWPEGGPLAMASGKQQAAAADAEQTGAQAGPQPPEAVEPETQPAGVLAKDGQHVIPFDVLEEARRRAADERERADRLQAELEGERQRQQQAAQPPQVDDVTAKWQERRGNLEKMLAEAQEDGDAQLMLAYQAQIDQGDELLEMRTGIAEMRQHMTQAAEAQHQQQVETEEQRISAALAASPVLTAWANDAAHPMWHQSAVDLNNALLQDPNSDYARMTWEQRFAELPRLVEERLGVPSPHRQGMPKPQTRRAEQVPYSISGIPGAQPVAPGNPTGPADTDGMTRQEQTKYMVGLYSDGRLFNNLRDFPIGSLNTGGRHDV